jgi:hypothetical protein
MSAVKRDENREPAMVAQNSAGTGIVFPTGVAKRGTGVINIGSQQGQFTNYDDATIGLVRLRTNVLSDQEVKQLYTNPWQIYVQPRQQGLNSITAAAIKAGYRSLLGVGI